MEQDYDHKFEEMKKYIPFLERMIQRLESNSTASGNPRQAQLAKIRSLRDLLLDKKKRMKMENLLKCEQVLVNLYAKVEQRDCLPELKNDIDTSLNSQKDELNFVRNKLKNVVSHFKDKKDTLPEIARASDTEEACTVGSKEPALFQRRPNKAPSSPLRASLNNNKTTLSPSTSRTYSRVLISPEHETDWPQEKSPDRPLYSRRTPKKSPRPLLSPQRKKERKKSVNQSQSDSQTESNEPKDFNITLKVPEASLNSLNTKDIVSRIINCHDNDVDIDTLRGLRTQILSELKQTGAKDDISDIILQSYKTKKKTRKIEEIEDGELSDSESEIIESVYGNLVIVDKEQKNTSATKQSDKKEDESRKIQICLVINSEKEQQNEEDKCDNSNSLLSDPFDFGSLKDSKRDLQNFDSKNVYPTSKDIRDNTLSEVDCRNVVKNKESLPSNDLSNTYASESSKMSNESKNVANSKSESLQYFTPSKRSDESKNVTNTKSESLQYFTPSKRSDESKNVTNTKSESLQYFTPSKRSDESKNVTNTKSESLEHYTPNKFKNTTNTKSESVEQSTNLQMSDNSNLRIEENKSKVNEGLKKQDQVEIPMMKMESTAKEVVHEIDILQALKKEILSEKMSLEDSGAVTPPLHQPKVTKVANIHGIITKKRISIEKYKEKASATSKPCLFRKQNKNISLNDELLKKQSLKLTDKEYERFNLSNRLAFQESSEDEDTGKRSPTIEDVYGDLAPKSPDHEDFADTGIKPPVIIPADPIKVTVVTSKADVDMRLLPAFSPSGSPSNLDFNDATNKSFEQKFEVSNSENEINSNEKRVPLGDPRVRREFNHPVVDSSILASVDRNPRPINFPSHVTPNLNTNVIPRPNPNLSTITQNSNINPTGNNSVYDTMPSRQTFENDDYTKNSHVFTSTFPLTNIYDNNDMVNNDGHNRDTFSRSRNNFANVRNDLLPMNQHQPLFAENPPPLFNRLDCPPTPIHPFGVSDCPPTPTHNFAILETPMAQISPFVRCEAPMTPVHPFGMDCPPTPSHPFGGRTETIVTQTHSFGMGDFLQNQALSQQILPSRYNSFQDSRANRSSDYNNFSKYDEKNDCNDYNERNTNFQSRNYKYDQRQRNYSDNYRHYGRAQSNARGNQNQCDTRYHDAPRRDSSGGRSMSRNYTSSRQFSVERNERRGRDYRYENDSARNVSDIKQNLNREQNIGCNLPEERNSKSIDSDFTSDNVVSVESNAFTIDTSVNRSFQEPKVSSFDARRRRASSVGRSLIGEQNFKSESNNTKYNDRSLRSNTDNNFRRARSVGREIAETQEKKNFKDIKEELQSYKHKHDDAFSKSKNAQPNKTNIKDVGKKANERDPRISRRDEYEYRRDRSESRNTKTSTPRGHYREHRLHAHSFDSRKKYYEDTRNNSRGIKKHGIVYSADNIAKGTILGTGYGVKNYKIPKIKKAPEESVCRNLNGNDKISKEKTTEESGSKNVKDDSETINTFKHDKKDGKRRTRWQNDESVLVEVEKDSASLKNIKKDIELKNEENISPKIFDNFEKRFTRSSLRKSVSELPEVKCVSPRSKDTKIKDIEHNSNKEGTEMMNLSLNSKKNVNEKNEEINTSEDQSCDNIYNENKKSLEDNKQLNGNMPNKDEHIHPSESVKAEDLKIDDISNTAEFEQSASIPDMFSDNIATDTIVENINDLIVHLGDDLESPECGTKQHFTQEITLENMLDNITCSSEKSDETRDESQGKETISELGRSSEVSHDITCADDFVKSKENLRTFTDSSSYKNKSQPNVNTDTSLRLSEVSTTDKENATTLLIKKQTNPNEDHEEPCSIPDSTIDLNENNQGVEIQEGVPDSTNELNCDISSEISEAITSTHVCSRESKDNLETNTSQNYNKNDSIGSFLSILKDKSKIKELLGMLQESSENYKLKKKLEKLSEIVSDEEDCDDSNTSNSAKIDDICSENKNHQKKDLNSIKENIDKESILEEQNTEDEQKIKREKESDEKDLTHSPGKGEVPNIENNKNEIDTTCSQNNSIEIEAVETNKKFAKETNAKKDKSSKDTSPTEKPTKKTSRELKQLQDDIKEMFMHGGFPTNNTGIRMCRLAKLVEDKNTIEKDEKPNTESSPSVFLEKVKQSSEDIAIKSKIAKKKQTSKAKITQNEILAPIQNDAKIMTEPKTLIRPRPGPKSKTKPLDKHADSDPYVFESDSFSESKNTTAENSVHPNSSDSECESLESSNSFGSSELLAEAKKKGKRKRPGWKAGIIKSKYKKKKVEMVPSEVPSSSEHLKMFSDSILDENCFTDVTYCFKKSVTDYSCRFCAYSGKDIVQHYKKQHPHSEIPLSRLSPKVAKSALEQCHGLDFQELRKIPSEKYVCRFCFKEFAKKKNPLEPFFWHVVNMHTGEYKQLCSECVNVTRCPFNLDIPSPPKEPKGQLTGYVCGKCNYTQVSLENLKSHVINRHDNIETEVFEINLSVMTKKFLNLYRSSTMEPGPRVLRSSRLNQSVEDVSAQNPSNDKEVIGIDDVYFEKDLDIKVNRRGKRNSIQSKITYENDDVVKEISEMKEFEDVDLDLQRQECDQGAPEVVSKDCGPISNSTNTKLDCLSDDVFDYPHFKVFYTETGTKEYDCCINGVEGHFRTPLLISFKKHVQIKHKEKWDGFCYVCKLIVTTQGEHYFKDCLEHFLDKHMDNFPVVETVKGNQDDNDGELSTTFLNVRPMSQLISSAQPELDETPLPIIESVVSLGSAADEPPPVCDRNDTMEKYTEGTYKYEEAQAAVIAGKNNIVVGIMKNREKLVHIFKCAGRYCSFSTDHAEDALRHAVAHERVGGENSLNCAYCNFDSSKNAVDLVTHVFKSHGSSPYVCGLCFYRAAASQLVRAHQVRVHKSEPNTIYRSTVSGRLNTTEKILPREIAVPMYECNQVLDCGACQFKTYTSGKFAEHLQLRHQEDSEFSCLVCSTKHTKIADLIQHMKGHGFKVYQCTWCVFGADNEAELLAHASEKHPNNQPQAYLRIITNKGTNGFRVLPLAQFNNSNVRAIDVAPNANKGNPEKEAERSIELEMLIGQTAQSMVASSNHTDQGPVKNVQGSLIGPVETFDTEPLDETEESLIMGQQSSLLAQTQEDLTAKSSPLAVITHVPPSEKSPNLMKLLIDIPNDIKQTPLLKIEHEVKTREKSNPDVVYCIESDDESPGTNVIDLSTENIPSTGENDKLESVRVPLNCLYKCGICPNNVLKNSAGFKRHVTATHHQELDKLTCAYCSFIGERDAIVKHYVSEHSLQQDAIKRYICGVCENKYVGFSYVKKHLKDDHNLTKLVVASKQKTKGECQFVVNAVPKSKPKTTVKRKLSGESNDKGAPAAKIKKFGLLDIESLPISPILDELVYCALCEFSTKVRLNMVRHLQLHAEQQPVPQTNPVNPVPHLETNEKHFDKMVNLASSSLAARTDKATKEQQTVVNSLVPPETISRFPKYVPERQRYTCGAKDCSYTSVDENMFKYHWDTLHTETNDYRCMHCPPHQHVNTSKPINATRIISHLKMHDVNLYACSLCAFYHNRRPTVEKHIAENHTDGRVMVVREEGEAVSTASNMIQSVNATPTMDLKPWQCGLCKFKSMLRPDVVNHCAKEHQSKMQYKCTYCAFRTSNMENITKHQSKSHGDKVADTFYFYYREGSIPDEPDGTPRWQKQRQKSGLSVTEVKTEVVENKELEPQNTSSKTITAPPPITIPVVDLNIVKKDPDADLPEQRAHDQCKTVSQLCEPDGLKYKCPLCEIVSEESKEAMQSHLYEELQYRKWACGFCSYRAFHKNGLKEHMDTEHCQYREPIELPVDSHIEMWIAKALDHQFLLIERNRHNMAKQVIINPITASKSEQADPGEPNLSGDEYSAENLKNIFGTFGEPDGIQFSCPKCNYRVREESMMRDHLEIELHKIRWCCSSCTQKYQNYHEAQFHCKSAHPGVAARAVEAVRDAGKRAAWVSALLLTQKLSMATSSDSLDTIDNIEMPEQNTTSDNSLLVERYEKKFPTSEMENVNSLKIPSNDSDEDEQRLIIDEPSKVEEVSEYQCKFCPFKCKDLRDFKDHNVLHTEIKPYFCPYCDLNGQRKTLLRHLENVHKGEGPLMLITKAQRSLGPPLKSVGTASAAATNSCPTEDDKLICLRCEKSFSEKDAKSHSHDNVVPQFAKKNDVVVKCCVCLSLHRDIEAANVHHQTCHPDVSLNYAYYKLQNTKRSMYCCAYCEHQFKYWRDFKVHCLAKHTSLPMEFSKRSFSCRITSESGSESPVNLPEDNKNLKRKSETHIEEPVHKMCARKSTSKLPVQSVAKKSTSKLPFPTENQSGQGEYCYYGSKPSLVDLENVRTRLSFCNTDISFTYKQLTEVIKIDPIVLVKDVTK